MNNINKQFIEYYKIYRYLVEEHDYDPIFHVLLDDGNYDSIEFTEAGIPNDSSWYSLFCIKLLSIIKTMDEEEFQAHLDFYYS
jgi:hypothetical protein